MKQIFYRETKALIVNYHIALNVSGVKQTYNKHLQTFTEYSYRKLNAKKVTLSILAKFLTYCILLLHPR